MKKQIPPISTLMLMLVAEEAKEFHLGEFRAGIGARFLHLIRINN